MNMSLRGQKKKILVLSGPLGHGHIQTAKSILEASQYLRGEVEVHVMDYMELTSPHLYQVGAFCYMQCIKTFPGVYGYFYHKTRRQNVISKAIKAVSGMSLRALEDAVWEVNPSIIVSTFPPAAAAVSKLKASGSVDCPTVTVITDHTDHSYWLNPYTDRYLVSSAKVAQALMAQGVGKSRIEVTGIPVRPIFYKKYDKIELRKKHGLDVSKLTVLVMGGGWGMIHPSFVRFLQQEQWKDRVQFVIVCGQNEKLREKLERIAEQSEVTTIVHGYVEQIHEWMACADLMITKPGGISTTEATIQQLPLLLYKALPGQEEDNVHYLVESGVAIYAPSEDELKEKFTYLLSHPEVLSGMKKRAEATEFQHSPYSALSAILNVSNQTASMETTRKSWKSWYRSKARESV
ncbi:Processive diacylglycerol beta-glucosyltransferase [Paenibacillus sp. CECT 9249]|uniref:MGDG synthase family glycosyltransferase n=1 Tax=Paenibacillus sp. CECT 9249 TaxID=2845385 RepID=UPI001E343A14|nr:glycosyltransferase [Paenibacillus sp. CECT 9249]CAH0118219.1 Processive diacylglycerol beta-glucosyltransferase [Paenibacillus sp. CECT 9249]